MARLYREVLLSSEEPSKGVKPQSPTYRRGTAPLRWPKRSLLAGVGSVNYPWLSATGILTVPV